MKLIVSTKKAWFYNPHQLPYMCKLRRIAFVTETDYVSKECMVFKAQQLPCICTLGRIACVTETDCVNKESMVLQPTPASMHV
jgi:hypothetical protein